MSMIGPGPTRVVDFITVEGFKSIKRVTGLPIYPINILIGPNGAGKTNLMEAFLLLDRIRNGNLQEYVIRAGGANRILHFGSAITQASDSRNFMPRGHVPLRNNARIDRV